MYCYIFGAIPIDSFNLKINENDIVIAADAGIINVRKFNIKPDYIIGDFDSLGYTPTDSNTIIHPIEKDDTDTMLAVKLGFKKGYKDFRIFGGIGGRLDHTFANIQTASYIAENADDFDGLILLGAYSTADISNTDLNVLSVYGSEDNVLNKEKYSECMPNLPSADEVVIKGGNHAFFGMYGKQKGDGMATITNIDQINETSGAVADFVFGEE